MGATPSPAMSCVGARLASQRSESQVYVHPGLRVRKGSPAVPAVVISAFPRVRSAHCCGQSSGI